MYKKAMISGFSSITFYLVNIIPKNIYIKSLIFFIITIISMLDSKLSFNQKLENSVYGALVFYFCSDMNYSIYYQTFFYFNMLFALMFIPN